MITPGKLAEAPLPFLTYHFPCDKRCHTEWTSILLLSLCLVLPVNGYKNVDGLCLLFFLILSLFQIQLNLYLLWKYSQDTI